MHSYLDFELPIRFVCIVPANMYRGDGAHESFLRETRARGPRALASSDADGYAESSVPHWTALQRQRRQRRAAVEFAHGAAGEGRCRLAQRGGHLGATAQLARHPL